MIGDFIGTAGHNRAVLSNSLELHESELGVQAIIDPYARGDFFFVVRRAGRERRRGLHHVHLIAQRIRRQSGQNARCFWKGEHHSQPRSRLH